MTGHTPETLRAFTEKVKRAFLEKRVHCPVHLCSDTQAEPLIDVFRQVQPEDWVFATWRSSFHAILKGIPEDWVFNEILSGRSMFLMNKEHRFFSSSIVGGILPVALGVAAGIKRANGGNRVFVFSGDMTYRTGIFHEFYQYAQGHGLPVRVVIEDNGLSTNADTVQTWGESNWEYVPTKYRYERTHPHVGVGARVQF